MAQILDRLLQHTPRVIGVDIYCNFPVPPGHDTLTELLRTHQNIVMVKKFGGDTLASVPPPPVLEHTDQVGFNDLLVDEDGVVRRGLLFLDEEGHGQAYSLALRLALKYLAADGYRSATRSDTARLPAAGPDHLLVADSTAQWLDQIHPLRSIGELTLKGRQMKIRVFQLGNTYASIPATPPTISTGGVI
jgi:CHASE2 domain-containing sensor protein